MDRETHYCVLSWDGILKANILYTKLPLLILLFASEIYFRSSQRSENFKSANRDEPSVLAGEANTRHFLPKIGLFTAVSHGGTFYRVKKKIGVKHFSLLGPCVCIINMQ